MMANKMNQDKERLKLACQYNKENPTEAVRAIARKFNVPHTMLNDHARGKTKSCVGCPPILSVDEEGAIMNWIVQMSEHGFPVTRARTIQKAQ